MWTGEGILGPWLGLYILPANCGVPGHGEQPINPTLTLTVVDD